MNHEILKEYFGHQNLSYLVKNLYTVTQAKNEQM